MIVCSSARNADFMALLLAGCDLAFTGAVRRTIQSADTGGVCLKVSRIIRLIMLRVTARGARRLATTIPRRPDSCSLALA